MVFKTFDHGSGADTETEEPPTKTTKTQSPSKKDKFAKYGKGKTISDSEHSGMEKAASPPRRSTRSSSRAPKSAMAPTHVRASPSRTRRGRPSPTKPSEAGEPAAPPVTRRTSPRRKLIRDSPPPEDKMDPFPPKPAPMTVTDKPAVLNRYGEKVPAPVDVAQRLRQAINFLSDEGVENCLGFEDKLDRLETWFNKNHTLGHGVVPEGQEDTEMLWRRVQFMIQIHRNRQNDGSDEWFSRHVFPGSSSIKDIKPQKGEIWRVTSQGTVNVSAAPPKKQVMIAQDRERAIKQSKAAAAKSSPTKAAAGTTSRNAPAAAASAAADEAVVPKKRTLPSMPLPEVWHRKEARRFPYGETPHMEQVMSRQITADLARGRENKEHHQGGLFYPLKRAWREWTEGGEPPAPFDPWALPEITQEELFAADKQLNVLGYGGGDAAAAAGRKRKSDAGDGGRSPGKRVRSG